MRMCCILLCPKTLTTQSNLRFILITDNVYEYILDNTTATENGDEIDLSIAPSMHLGELYIGIEDLCKAFGYAYEYDKATYTVSIQYDKVPSLPRDYDL